MISNINSTEKNWNVCYRGSFVLRFTQLRWQSTAFHRIWPKLVIWEVSIGEPKFLSFWRFKWFQTKITCPVLWHSSSRPFTWCDLFSYKSFVAIRLREWKSVPRKGAKSLKRTFLFGTTTFGSGKMWLISNVCNFHIELGDFELWRATGRL